MKKLKVRQLLLVLLIPIINLQGQAPGLLPVPARVTWGPGKFRLVNANIVVTAEYLEREHIALDDQIDFIRQRTGILLPTGFSEAAGIKPIVLSPDAAGPKVPVPGEMAGPESRESYTLRITGDRITVTGKSDAGIWCALQTLRQMIMKDADGYYIPQAEITDYPVMAYRGVMMDMSHGGLPTEEEIKRQIDFLALWKMNQYYFYNEVSIEMKGYPLINYNACYTQDQIKRIVAYGRERHIDVIPFVEFYGHLHELLRIEKYAGLGIGKYGHDLDPRDPGVQTILSDWIGQYAVLFPSPFIHIGFDETWETERLKKEDTSIVPRELYLRQLNLVASQVQGFGKKIMVWTDISNNYPDIISEFPKDIIPVLWEYSDQPASVDKWLEPVRKENLPFFVQSAVDSWGNVYPASAYTFDNIDICLKTCRDEKAIGYITSVWTDAVQPLLRNTWLFMAYGCAGAWQDKPVDRKSFTRDYCTIMYPEISDPMAIAFEKMAESEDYLARGLGRHTLSQMWEDPFSKYHLVNTKKHEDDYKRARLSAEEATGKLCDALQSGTRDTAMIRTLLLNSRLLDFTAARFLWAKTIVDRWNWIYDLKSKGEKDYVMHYDINYTTHGLLVDMMDYCTGLKEEYACAWLSENMPYRMGTMTGRFDAEFLMWRKLSVKIAEYINHSEEKIPRQKFEKLFLKSE